MARNKPKYVTKFLVSYSYSRPDGETHSGSKYYESQELAMAYARAKFAAFPADCVTYSVEVDTHEEYDND